MIFLNLGNCKTAKLMKNFIYFPLIRHLFWQCQYIFQILRSIFWQWICYLLKLSWYSILPCPVYSAIYVGPYTILSFDFQYNCLFDHKDFCVLLFWTTGTWPWKMLCFVIHYNRMSHHKRFCALLYSSIACLTTKDSLLCYLVQLYV